MLHSFSPCNLLVKTKLFESFCLSLYGSALRFSSPELRSLEVTFNNILRRIWSLPSMCHTGVLHCTAQLNSVYNIIVVQRSSKLLSAALKSHSSLLRDTSVQSSTLTYTSIGYNSVFGSHHKKIYTDQDSLCANFIQDVRLAPDLNSYLNQPTYTSVWKIISIEILYYYRSTGLSTFQNHLRVS